MLVVDPQQHVEMANPAARRLLGVRPREEGRGPAASGSRPSRCGSRWPTSCGTNGNICPRGSTRPSCCKLGEQSHSFLPRILPIRDSAGVTLGAAMLLEDVTRFRLLDEVKSNLVATVSHELKTPLTSIRLAIHLLLEESVGPLVPKQLELLVDARDNAERLLAMIKNLLDLARLEQGPSQLHLQPQRPAALLQAAAEAFRPRAADKASSSSLEDCRRPAGRWPSTPTSSSTPCGTCWTTPWRTRRRAAESPLAAEPARRHRWCSRWPTPARASPPSTCR